MNKNECCQYIIKQLLNNFDSIINTSKVHQFMGLSDLLISIKNRKLDRLTDDENEALNRKYCEIALEPLVRQTYDELDALYLYLCKGQSFHDVLYQIMCEKLK